MNRASGHFCAHTGTPSSGEPPDDGEMSEMTLPSKHRIQTLEVWGQARYLSVTDAPQNTTWMFPLCCTTDWLVAMAYATWSRQTHTIHLCLRLMQQTDYYFVSRIWWLGYHRKCFLYSDVFKNSSNRLLDLAKFSKLGKISILLSTLQLVFSFPI